MENIKHFQTVFICFHWISGASDCGSTSSKTTSPHVSRPLKSRAMGMISGVATNLKSRLSQFNVSPGANSNSSNDSTSSSSGSKLSFSSPTRSSNALPNASASAGAVYYPPSSSSSINLSVPGPAAESTLNYAHHKRPSLGGEQPASVIPLTVPGADTSKQSSFPYSK